MCRRRATRSRSQNVYRPDEVGETLTLAQALQNAPDAADGRFRVTAILGEEQ